MNIDTTTFIKSESLNQMSRLLKGKAEVQLVDGIMAGDHNDYWLGQLCFVIKPDIFWRLDLRYRSFDARFITAKVLQINPDILPLSLIHSSMCEFLNTIAGPVKNAILNGQHAKIASHSEFKPMIPKVIPANIIDTTSSDNPNLNSISWTIHFEGRRIGLHCLWSKNFPNHMVRHETASHENSMEFL